MHPAELYSMWIAFHILTKWLHQDTVRTGTRYFPVINGGNFFEYTRLPLRTTGTEDLLRIKDYEKQCIDERGEHILLVAAPRQHRSKLTLFYRYVAAYKEAKQVR